METTGIGQKATLETWLSYGKEKDAHGPLNCRKEKARGIWGRLRNKGEYSDDGRKIQKRNLRKEDALAFLYDANSGKAKSDKRGAQKSQYEHVIDSQ